MKRIGKLLGIMLLGLTVLVGISGRRISELMGYARATADKTVEQLEDSVPAAVRDQKLQNDIETARGEIIDRRVKLNLAASEVRRLQDEVGQLTAAVERRELILAEAYPALETASADRLTEVSFAGTKWQPLELGGEIDRLLMEQDRDERQLTIRREALDRVVKSIDEGTAAITEMASRLLEAENEFQTLVVRREQAQNENELLDLVASAGRSGKTVAANIGSTLEGLRGDVETLEARNDARRDVSPLQDRETSKLTQAWGRLERLKALHDKRSPQQAEGKTQPSASVPLTNAAPVKSAEVSEGGDATTSETVPADKNSASTGVKTNGNDKNVVIVIRNADVADSQEKSE